MAAAIAYDDASDNTEEFATDVYLYWILDDLLEGVIEFGLTAGADPALIEEILLDPIRQMSTELLNEKHKVRTWFGDFIPTFEDRADDHEMKYHTYTYSTINEYLQAFGDLHQKQTNILAVL